MQRWSDHVREVTGDEPQFVPGKIIDLTERDIDLAAPADPDDPFGAGDSYDVVIPGHLLKGGARNDHYFDWR
ncbi:MAG: hypothetical protein OES57_07925 [Acidimicrobiia bacterium]|nr:hypothetical protein [Acidimicrobiia bacterium]